MSLYISLNLTFLKYKLGINDLTKNNSFRCLFFCFIALVYVLRTRGAVNIVRAATIFKSPAAAGHNSPWSVNKITAGGHA